MNIINELGTELDVSGNMTGSEVVANEYVKELSWLVHSAEMVWLFVDKINCIII